MEYKEEVLEYICSAYTRNATCSLEKGMIVRLFSKASSDTLILHIAHEKLVELCETAGQHDLVRDSVTAFEDLSNNDPEDVRLSDLGLGLERTDRPELLKAMQERVLNVVLTYVRVRDESNLQVPYFMEE